MSLGLAVRVGKLFFSARRKDFYGDLAEALRDDASLPDELETHHARLKDRNDLEAPLFSLWLNRLDDQSFPEALRGTVPRMDVMILSAAEAAGNLTAGLEFLAVAVGAASKMKAAVWGALARPAMYGLMALSYILLYTFQIDPMLAGMLSPARWPFLGQVLHFIADLIRDWGLPISVGTCLAIGGIYWSLSRWAGRSRKLAEKVFPLYAIYRDYTGSIFLVAMAAMMQSGVGIAEALAELGRDAMPWLRWHIDEITHRLDTASEQPARAFATGIFSQTITDRIEDFGRRADFESAIGKVGLATVERLVNRVTVSAGIANILALVTVTAIVLVIFGGTLMVVLSAVDGMYTMNNAVSR